MHIVESNKIQNALLVFIEVKSLVEDIKLETPVVINGDTMTYLYTDKNVVDGLEYTYSVVAYDMGVEPPF